MFNFKKKYIMKIYFKSTKFNNVDKVCVIWNDSFNTTKYITPFGDFTMKNSSEFPGHDFSQPEAETILKKLKQL